MTRLLLLCLLAAPLRAGFFLSEAPTGARALALAEGLSAALPGLDGLGSNPASLAGLSAPALVLSQNTWLDDSLQGRLGGAWPWAAWTLGGQVQVQSLDGLDERDADGVLLSRGSLRRVDGALLAATDWNETLALGLRLGGRRTAWPGGEEAGGQAGLGARLHGHGLGLGAWMQWSGLDAPRGQVSALASTGLGGAWRVTAGLGWVSEGLDSRAGLGAELGYGDSAALRLGLQRLAADAGALWQPSAGLGFSVGGLALDYGLLWLPDLGWAQQVDLGLRFGARTQAPPPAATPTPTPTPTPVPSPVETPTPTATPTPEPGREVQLEFVVPAAAAPTPTPAATISGD